MIRITYHSIMDRETNGQDSNGTVEEVKNVVCVDVSNAPKNYNVLELALGRVNYNTLLSALCSVKDTNLRNKGLAAFFAKNKSFCSVECQTDCDMFIDNVYDDGVEDNLSYESGIADDGSGGDVEPCASTAEPQGEDMYPEVSFSYTDSSHAKVSSSSQSAVSHPQPSDLTAHSSPCYSTTLNTTDNDPPVQESGESPSDNGIESIVTCNSETEKSSAVDESSSHKQPATEQPNLVLEAGEQQTMDTLPHPLSIRKAAAHRTRDSPSNEANGAVTSPVSGRTTSEGRKRKSSHYKKPTVSTKLILSTVSPSADVPAAPVTSEETASGPEFCYDEKGVLEIHRAVLSQDSDALLFCGENLKRRGHSVDQKTKYEGYTPLQLALVSGCEPSMIKVLIWLGCDPLACDARGRPTLLIALQPTNRTELNASVRISVKKFIFTLATEKPKIFEEVCQQTDEQGLTVLMQCAINSWAESMQLLLLHMPPHLVDLQLPSSGMTALHMAMLAYSTALDNNRLTFNSCKCITLLQNSGASDQIADAEGVTPRDLTRTPLVRTSVGINTSDKRKSVYGRKKHLIVDEGSRFKPGTRRTKTESHKTKKLIRHSQPAEFSNSKKMQISRKFSAQDSRNVSAQDNRTVSTKGCRNVSTQDGRNVSTQDSRNVSTQDGGNVYKYTALPSIVRSIIICHSHIKVRRSYRDLKEDKTLQPFVKLLMNKKLNQLALRLRATQICPVNAPRTSQLVQSNISVKGSHISVKGAAEDARSLLNRPSGAASAVLAAGGHKKTKTVNPNKSMKQANVKEEDTMHEDNARSASPIVLSPKKKWLSRNKKWSEKSKEVLPYSRRRRRCSLGSIGNDVEIIKRAAAMQPDIEDS